ncbi:malate dehydrogenase [Cordyceps fumosorosea ARSEF 2679]|uniref:Malate dehydrogenase n=1 Tax=Cordyceps fumosorosea (strain ARSEF 2679) TaxID=1081104 RepID=A0A167PM35_CORFA|nr:malate dehydrogenase [Cordyceps fumosorosea ARSEF 2679]OAA56806.1 malate dehydrogenase [Cordyceps fumosorosea ARSEF 2679]
MLSKSLLLLLASAASVLSAPAACPAPKSVTPTLPSSGGAKDLTNPPEGLKLLHVALGFGIQNYTCTTQGPGAANATGALAVLYDARPLYPLQGARSLPSTASFAALPGSVLASHPVPLNLDNFQSRADPSRPGASLTSPFPTPADLTVEGVAEPLRYIGHHFFTDKGVPAFFVDDGEIFLTAKKDEAVDAPADADKGPDGTGAVAWLKLSATEEAKGPAKLVYRVLTAGGNSHGCAAGVGEDSTSYTATYWFYG